MIERKDISQANYDALKVKDPNTLYYIKRKMTDKQKLLEWLNHYCTDFMTFEDIIDKYIQSHANEFSAHRINYLTRLLNDRVVWEIEKMDKAIRVAHERATYIKCYLEGNMYADEEAAKQCVGIQIENAKAILDRTERVVL